MGKCRAGEIWVIVWKKEGDLKIMPSSVSVELSTSITQKKKKNYQPRKIYTCERKWVQLAQRKVMHGSRETNCKQNKHWYIHTNKEEVGLKQNNFLEHTDYKTCSNPDS